MEEKIIKLLDSWKNLPANNPVIEKDYFFDGDKVFMSIAISIETSFLFKAFTAKCSLDEQEINSAIDRLDELKDKLI